MQNYAKIQSKDRTDEVMFNAALPFPAIATLQREQGNVSSVTALNPNTTVIEVGAVTTGVGIKWVTSQATSVVSSGLGVSYDNFIPAGAVRQFVVPRNTQSLSSGYTSIVGLNVQEGLYPAVATINVGAGSVLLTQY